MGKAKTRCLSIGNWDTGFHSSLQLKYILFATYIYFAQHLYAWILSHVSSTIWSRLHSYFGKLSTLSIFSMIFILSSLRVVNFRTWCSYHAYHLDLTSHMFARKGDSGWLEWPGIIEENTSNWPNCVGNVMKELQTYNINWFFIFF